MMLTLAVLVTITGLVTADGDVLPGATVTLSNGTINRQAVTDETGRFVFVGAREGTYDLRYELAGLQTVERRFTVSEERAEVEPQDLPLDPVEQTITITTSCAPCSQHAPVTPYDFPLCSDFDLHSEWMDAADGGDRSARDLLRKRYTEMTSLVERHRIGVVLDDPSIWKELLADAELCVRFPRAKEEFSQAWLEWCDARDLPPEHHWSASYDALLNIAGDRRSHALLVRALETHDDGLLTAAIVGLATQRDLASLPHIERALSRHPDSDAVIYLALFKAPEADAIAERFLGDRSDSYAELRNEDP